MRLLRIALLVCSSLALADEMPSFQAGKEFAESAKDRAAEQLKGDVGAAQLPHYNDNAPEGGHFQGGRGLVGDFGNTRKSTCQTHSAKNAFDQQECDAVNYLSKHGGQRKKFNLDKNDPLLTGSRDIINDPQGGARGGRQNCRVERLVKPATFLRETCTEAMVNEEMKCNRTLLVTCDPESDGCDPGGIIPGSWAGDMAVSFLPAGGGDYTFQFGTIADNYWKGRGAVFDRMLSFEVRDVELINKFILTYAAYDDWLLVKLNDVLLYVGPKSGDKLESAGNGQVRVCGDPVSEHASRKKKGQPLVNPNCVFPAEGKMSWKIPLSIDLRPHLHNGKNTIFMRTIVGGNGEGAIQITARQKCPRNCYDRWDDSECTEFEARTR